MGSEMCIRDRGIVPTPANVADFLLSVGRGDGKIGRRIEV